MDVAPETPPEAGDAANQLVGQFCGINECGIHTLLYRAARADAEANKVFEGAVVGESTLFDNERYQRAFGYSLAMEAVGHGVSWFDDQDRPGVVAGKRVSVGVDLGGRRSLKKKKNKN